MRLMLLVGLLLFCVSIANAAFCDGHREPNYCGCCIEGVMNMNRGVNVSGRIMFHDNATFDEDVKIAGDVTASDVLVFVPSMKRSGMTSVADFIASIEIIIYNLTQTVSVLGDAQGITNLIQQFITLNQTLYAHIEDSQSEDLQDEIDDLQSQIDAIESSVNNFNTQLSNTLALITATTQGQIFALQQAIQADIANRSATAQIIISNFNNSIAGPFGKQAISVTRTTNTNIAGLASFVLTFDQTDYITNNITYNSGTGAVTIGVPGIYYIDARLTFTSLISLLNSVTLNIEVNGVPRAASYAQPQIGVLSTIPYVAQTSREMLLAAGDVVRIAGVCNSLLTATVLGDSLGLNTGLTLSRTG